jgi:hypothetical protein
MIDPQVVGFAAILAFYAVVFAAWSWWDRRKNSGSVVASTPATEPDPAQVPDLCQRVGHKMRLTSEHPRIFSCVHDGCGETTRVDVKHIHVSPELATRLVLATTEQERRAAWDEVMALAAQTPTEEEILDAAVEEFAAELPAVESFANGEGRAS